MRQWRLLRKGFTETIKLVTPGYRALPVRHLFFLLTATWPQLGRAHIWSAVTLWPHRKGRVYCRYYLIY